jgi:hypothetical protein
MKKNDVVKELLKLPSIIKFEGISFELNIFINDTDEVRLAYVIDNVSDDSEHKETWDKYFVWKNPFINYASYCTYLILHENISNDKELIDAIRETSEFITRNKLSTI